MTQARQSKIKIIVSKVFVKRFVNGENYWPNQKYRKMPAPTTIRLKILPKTTKNISQLTSCSTFDRLSITRSGCTNRQSFERTSHTICQCENTIKSCVPISSKIFAPNLKQWQPMNTWSILPSISIRCNIEWSEIRRGKLYLSSLHALYARPDLGVLLENFKNKNQMIL